MAWTDSYLSSSANGKLNLKGTEISEAHKNFIKSPEFPSYFPGTDVIGTVDFLGSENPKVVIQGLFDETVTPMISSLRAFRKDTTSVVIYDPIFFATPQAIQIEDLQMSRKVSDGRMETGGTQIKGTIVNYSITATLT